MQKHITSQDTTATPPTARRDEGSPFDTGRPSARALHAAVAAMQAPAWLVVITAGGTPAITIQDQNTKAASHRAAVKLTALRNDAILALHTMLDAAPAYIPTVCATRELAGLTFRAVAQDANRDITAIVSAEEARDATSAAKRAQPRQSVSSASTSDLQSQVRPPRTMTTERGLKRRKRNGATSEDSATLATIAKRVSSGGRDETGRPPLLAPPENGVRDTRVDGTKHMTASPTTHQDIGERDRLIVHELRTPIGAIRTIADVVLAAPATAVTPDRLVQYLADIRDSSDHALAVLDRLANGMAATTSPNEAAVDQAGRSCTPIDQLAATRAMPRTDIGQLLDQCVRQLNAQARAKGVGLSIDRARQSPLIGRADATSLRQAIDNLLVNAIQHTGAGGRVMASACAHRDGAIVIEVRDTGRGMTRADVLKSLRQTASLTNEAAVLTNCSANAQDTSSDRRHYGLTIVKSVIDRHRGRMSIDSRIGIGTRVRLTLPLER